MNEPKVDKETALADFDRFTSTMDLDVETDDMDQDDLQSFEDVKAKVVKALMAGTLVVDDKGQPCYTPTGMPDANRIVFYEPTGASLMAMDQRKESQNVGKMMVLMGDITKTTANVFTAMPMRDLKVCQAITTLFLG